MNMATGRTGFCILLLGLLGFAILGQAQDAPLCTGNNRGWLKSGADIGEHPTGLFGPLGLHGIHEMQEKQPSNITIVVIKAGVPTPYYYPNELYTIKLLCSETCAFLLTVESGTTSESSVDNQLGSFENVELNDRIQSFKGLKPYVAVTNTEILSKDYTIEWRAPAVLTYEPLHIRVSYVLDLEFTCLGYFEQETITSEVVCGDGYKDDVEDCDDGNQIDGDGCSSVCRTELGWICSHNDNVSTCEQTLLVIRPISRSATVVEGGVGLYYISLSSEVQIGKKVIVLADTPTGSELSVLGPNSFEFENSGEFAWNVERTVAFGSNDNSEVDATRTKDIVHSISSTDTNYQWNYGPEGLSLPAPIFSVTLLDNDGVGVQLSKFNLTVAENGEKDIYTMRLLSEPVGSVIINTFVNADNQLQVTPKIPFNKANWDQEQAVYVSALDNNDIDGTVELIISHEIDLETTNDPKYRNLTLDDVKVYVTKEDNDAAGIVVAPRTLSVDENGQYEEYSVVCVTSPTSLLTIYMNGGEGLEVLSPQGFPYLYFDRNTWYQPQFVRVTALNNQYQDGARIRYITHNITTQDEDYAALVNGTDYPWTVDIQVRDDDIAAVKHAEFLDVFEGEGASVLNLTLTTIPYSPVRVYFALDDPTYLTIGGVEKEGGDRFIEWSPEDWDSRKSVLIQTGADNVFPDNEDSGTRSTTMRMYSVSDDPAYDDIISKSVEVTTYDNDVAKVTVSPRAGLQVTEGQSALFTVTLDTKPQLQEDDKTSHVVRVNILGDNQTYVQPKFVIFDADNYTSVVPIRVFAYDDTIVEAEEHGSIITFGIQTTDPQYSKVVIQDLRVDVIENDVTLVTQTVTRWGGTVSPMHPIGKVLVTLPVGSVPSTGLNVSVGEVEPPALPGVAAPAQIGITGFRVSGIYSFEPHGVKFPVPVQISIEYDIEAAKSVGGELVFYRSAINMEGPWQAAPGANFYDGIGALETDGFSLYFIGASPVAPPPPMLAPPTPVDPCEGLVTPQGDEVSDAEFALIGILAAENLLAMVGVIAYVAWRRRQEPQVIHVTDDEHDVLNLPPPENAALMALPGPYDGRVAVTEAFHSQPGQVDKLTPRGSPALPRPAAV